MIGDKIYKPLVSATENKMAQYAELANWCNENSAHIEDKGEYYEAVVNPEPTAQELIREEVQTLKGYLASTDYAVVKCYDRGLVFADEYPELYVKRQQARDRINELEN